MSHWKLTPFGDLAILRREGVDPAEAAADPYIGLEHIEPGALRLREVGLGSQVASVKSRFYAGDVLYGKLRPYFRKVVQPSFDGICSTDFWVLRPQPGIDPTYLFYLVASPSFTAVAVESSMGTRMPRAAWDHVARWRVPVPPPKIQKQIGERLRALDDRVECNQRLVSLLEQLLAVELQTAETAGQVVEVPVAELAVFANGGAYTKGATGSGRMVIRIAELNGGPSDTTVYNELEVPDSAIARPGDILMSWSGSLGVYRWFREEAIINQHIFKVLCDDLPAWLVYLKLKEVMPEFRRIASDKATTMGHIKRHHLEDTKVVLPSSSEIARLDGRLADVWARLVAAEVETTTLQELRDALLPEFLFGDQKSALEMVS